MAVTGVKVKPLIAGNWKMNGGRKGMTQLKSLVQRLTQVQVRADIMICPPSLDISAASEITKGSKVTIGGQDCHANPDGPHTGDISAAMLKQFGVKAVIVGHSERRRDYTETDKGIKAKAEAAVEAGLSPIVCIGETLQERKAGKTLRVVGAQLRGSLPDTDMPDKVVVAYEPVWAIGTGLTPTPDQVAQVHLHIRKALIRRYGAGGAAIRILYGGSVNPGNAAELLGIEHVNGALVGGASLKSADFIKIITAA
ncbi:MAG: triose-phosphate isomerase [Parvibaculales bacterium]